ncbi:T cell receptor alpha chain MC.7.G5-like [Pholidichthys leucotaenia]
MLLLLCLLLSPIIGLKAQDTITPERSEFSETEGESVTLACKYKTGYTTADLYWYRHQSDLQAPQFILRRRGKGGSSEYIPDKKRYGTQTSDSSTSLTIKVLTLADSALYYCALETRLNHCATLTFGMPITLTVLPKETTPLAPSLFVLNPLQPAGYPPQTADKIGPSACLATHFRPREGQMVLNVDGDVREILNTTKAELYKKKSSYVFVGFSNKTIHSCELHNTFTNNEIDDNCPSFYPENARVNFFVLLLNGIRVIFTKALAFSTALTIRAVL